MIRMNYLSKLSLFSCFKYHVNLSTRIRARSCIPPMNQRNFQRIAYNNLKLVNNSVMVKNYSTDKKSDSIDISANKRDVDPLVQSTAVKVNQRTKLKQAVRDYGATIIVFHVAISLASLGVCYLAISNGVDAVRLLTFIGFSESVISSKVAVGGSTFVIAYAVHKLFAPVRIGITLSVAPFIVRYLRRINWLKSPAKKV